MAFDVTITLYGNGAPKPVTLIGRVGCGPDVLICERIPMEERHLYGGAGGGYSRAALQDEQGRPKLITRCRIVRCCDLHQLAWEGSAACPRCEPLIPAERTSP